MAETIEHGIVIKKQNYQDNDLIVTILSTQGKFSFIALGVRKLISKNRVALQLGNLIEIEVFRARLNNKLSKLKKAHTIKFFPFDKYDNSEVMMSILFIINKLPEPKPFFYEELVKVYKFFGAEHNHQIKTYIKFLNLKQHGLNPIMDRCYKCQNFKDIISFDLERGGFVCKNHGNKKTPLETLKAYRDLGSDILEYIKVDASINFQINKEIDAYSKKFMY